MLDGEIGLTRPEPENAAQVPAVGEARVERQSPVGQPNHRAYVLAEASEHPGGIGEDARVVLSHLERLPGKVAGLGVSCLRLSGPTVTSAQNMADRCPGKCGSKIPINRDRLLKE